MNTVRTPSRESDFRVLSGWPILIATVAFVGNIYNRLVVYRGNLYHRSVLPGFGTDKHTGRLFQTFFFDTK